MGKKLKLTKYWEQGGGVLKVTFSTTGNFFIDCRPLAEVRQISMSSQPDEPRCEQETSNPAGDKHNLVKLNIPKFTNRQGLYIYRKVVGRHRISGFICRIFDLFCRYPVSSPDIGFHCRISGFVVGYPVYLPDI